MPGNKRLLPVIVAASDEALRDGVGLILPLPLAARLLLRERPTCPRIPERLVEMLRVPLRPPPLGVHVALCSPRDGLCVRTVIVTSSVPVRVALPRVRLNVSSTVALTRSLVTDSESLLPSALRERLGDSVVLGRLRLRETVPRPPLSDCERLHTAVTLRTEPDPLRLTLRDAPPTLNDCDADPLTSFVAVRRVRLCVRFRVTLASRRLRLCVGAVNVSVSVSVVCSVASGVQESVLLHDFPPPLTLSLALSLADQLRTCECVLLPLPSIESERRLRLREYVTGSVPLTVLLLLHVALLDAERLVVTSSLRLRLSLHGAESVGERGVALASAVGDIRVCDVDLETSALLLLLALTDSSRVALDEGVLVPSDLLVDPLAVVLFDSVTVPLADRVRLCSVVWLRLIVQERLRSRVFVSL